MTNNPTVTLSKSFGLTDFLDEKGITYTVKELRVIITVPEFTYTDGWMFELGQEFIKWKLNSPDYYRMITSLAI